jgi:peptidoglycan hydrolase-like protein with peptidoglycan-binding domain
MLNEVLNISLNINGVFGPQTTKAVQEFESNSNIPQDGILGSAAWPLLISSLPPVGLGMCCLIRLYRYKI